MKQSIITLALLLFGLTAYSQVDGRCCPDGIHYMANGNVTWQTEEGRALRENLENENLIPNPFEEEIVSDKPLHIKIVNISGNPIVWGEQRFEFQREEKIELDLRSLIEGRYKLIFMLDEQKAEKFFEYKFATSLLGDQK